MSVFLVDGVSESVPARLPDLSRGAAVDLVADSAERREDREHWRRTLVARERVLVPSSRKLLRMTRRLHDMQADYWVKNNTLTQKLHQAEMEVLAVTRAGARGVKEEKRRRELAEIIKTQKERYEQGVERQRYKQATVRDKVARVSVAVRETKGALVNTGVPCEGMPAPERGHPSDCRLNLAAILAQDESESEDEPVVRGATTDRPRGGRGSPELIQARSDLEGEGLLLGMRDAQKLQEVLRLEGAEHLLPALLAHAQVATLTGLAALRAEQITKLPLSPADRQRAFFAWRTACSERSVAESGGGVSRALTSRWYPFLFAHRHLPEPIERKDFKAQVLELLKARRGAKARQMLRRDGRDVINEADDDGFSLMHRICALPHADLTQEVEPPHNEPPLLPSWLAREAYNTSVDATRPDTSSSRVLRSQMSARTPRPALLQSGDSALESPGAAADFMRIPSIGAGQEQERVLPQAAPPRTPRNSPPRSPSRSPPRSPISSRPLNSRHSRSRGNISHSTSSPAHQRGYFQEQQVVKPKETTSSLLVQALIECKGDVRATNKYGRTPLHYAAMEGNAPLCHGLIHAGADADAEDAVGMVPLVHAKLMKRGLWGETAAVLLKAMKVPPAPPPVDDDAGRKGKKGKKGKKPPSAEGSERPTSSSTKQ